MPLKLFRPNDDSHAFKPVLAEIEDRPLNPMGHLIVWVILGSLLFAGLWMYLGQVDVVVTAQGKVLPEGDVKTLQSLEAGTVQRILAREGQRVRKNQILLEIDPTVANAELTAARHELAQVQDEIRRLKALTSEASLAGSVGQGTQRALLRASAQAEQAHRQSQQELLRRLDADLAKNRAEAETIQSQLTAKQAEEQRLSGVLDLIAKREYEQIREDIRQYQGQLASLRQQRDNLGHQRQQLQYERYATTEALETERLEQLADRERQLASLQARIDEARFHSRKQFIRSPVDGYIDKVLVDAPGAVVTAAQPVSTVIPSDAPLIIKAQIPNRDIGFVKPRMAALIKVEAFEFQRYGALRGTVERVARNSQEDAAKNLVYEAVIRPKETRRRVDGVSMQLTPGMAASVDVTVGRRRVLDFFLNPLIKHLREGTQVR